MHLDGTSYDVLDPRESNTVAVKPDDLFRFEDQQRYEGDTVANDRYCPTQVRSDT